MYRLIQRYQKQFLAVFAAVLMVIFIIPPAAKYGSSTRRGRIVGHMGKTEVDAEQLAAARDEWSLLTQRLGQGGGVQFIINKIGPSIAGNIERKPDLFLLLQQEAEKDGIRVSDDLVNTVVTNQIPSSMFLGPQQLDILRRAVRHVLEVSVLHDRVASSVKISQPMLIHDNITQWESVRLNVVQIPANDYKLAATQPTTQQVQEQFDKYKDVQADSTTASPTDPLGFGYKVPNRVKLQYIALDRKAVTDSIRAGKSAYDWEVQARIYYDEHQDEFVRAAPATQPTTQPATQPTTVATTEPTTAPVTTQTSVASTQPATQPATQPTVAQGPTTRPFAEVKDEILDKLIAPEADKLSADVVSSIKQRLDTSWQSYQRGSNSSGATSAPATQPTAVASTEPTTQPAGYDSYAFLENLALQIQSQYKLLPTVRQLGEWEDAQQLAKEQGIGTSHTADFRAFPQYATEDAIAFNPATQPSMTMLHLYQPSELLTDAQKSSYIFRLTAASPAHAPQLADIQARVEDDTKTRLAYGEAQAEARKVLEQAQKDGLSAAAVAAHRAVTSTGSFRVDQRFIPNFMAGPRAIEALIGKTRALLEEASPSHPHPVALVEMPSERKVIVVELADVSMDANDSQLFTAKLRALATEQIRRVEELASTYFSYDTVAARLNYTPEKSEKESGT